MRAWRGDGSFWRCGGIAKGSAVEIWKGLGPGDTSVVFNTLPWMSGRILIKNLTEDHHGVKYEQPRDGHEGDLWRGLNSKHFMTLRRAKPTVHRHSDAETDEFFGVLSMIHLLPDVEIWRR